MLRKMVFDQTADTSGGGAAAAKSRGGALFAVPRLLVGLTAKCAPDCDSPSRSPTSPLDFRAFPALGGPVLRSPRSPRSWDSRRAGLGGLVDSLAEADAKNCLLGSRVRPSTPSQSSVPRNCGHLPTELGEVEAAGAGGKSVPCSRFYGDVKSGPEVIGSGGVQFGVKGHLSDRDLAKFPVSGSLPVSIGGPHRFIGSVSATEIEQSEDYTCIIAHGPNPKTTHIFGDCILEPCTVKMSDGESKEAKEVKEGAECYWLVKCPVEAGDGGEEFLRSCLSCSKKKDGNDTCIYRGEKAFCSGNCRDQEVLIEEEVENSMASSPSSACSSSFHDDVFMAGMVVAT